MLKRLIEEAGRHPFVTGLLALLGVAGFILSIVGYARDRSDSYQTTVQLEKGFVETGDKIDATHKTVEHIDQTIRKQELDKSGKYQDGTFLYEDPVEGVYSNFWTAYILKMDPSPEITVRGEGKTVEFSGTIVLNCENGKYYWSTGSDFDNPLSEEEIDQLVPSQAIRAMKRIFCWDKF